MEGPGVAAQGIFHETLAYSLLSHRTSHLKSKTYRKLVHILSNCYGQSEVSLATPISVKAEDRRSEATPATEDETHQLGQFFGPDAEQTERLQPGEAGTTGQHSGDGQSCETRMVLDQVDDIMQVSEDEDVHNQKDQAYHDIADLNVLNDVVADRQQMLMKDLECIIRGDEDLVPENCMKHLETALNETQLNEIQSGTDAVASLHNEGHCSDFQQILHPEPLAASEPQIDGGLCAKKTYDVSDITLEVNTGLKVSRASNNGSDFNSLEAVHETQLNEMEMRISGTHCTLPSNISMLKDSEIEEGEILGEPSNDDSTDTFVRSSFRVEEKCIDHVPDKATDKELLPCNKSSRPNNGDSMFSSLGPDTTSRIGSSLEMAISGVNEATETTDGYNFTSEDAKIKNQSEGVEVGCQLASAGGQVSDQEALVQSGNKNQGISSEAKTHAEVGHQIKRRTLSREGKAKKKQKERHKRAEKRRQLGVKRLKLRPVLQQKPVEYCRHYIKGRCHEGEKCKYSHDTTPLTKSTPCCYFARQECMKGYDCPFDHDLSKYPCHRYQTSGFCSRGDNCMFSHKVPLKDNTSSQPLDVGKSEMGLATLSTVPCMKEQPNLSESTHRNVGSRSFSPGFVLKEGNRRSASEASPKEHSSKRSILQVSSPLSKFIHRGSSQKINGSGRAGTQFNRAANVLSVTKPTASPTPNTLPKDQGGTSWAISLVGVGDGARSSPLENSTFYEQALLKPAVANPFSPGCVTSPSMSSIHQSTGEKPNDKSLPAVIPKGMSFLSFGTGLVRDPQNEKQIALAFGPKTETPPDNHLNPSTSCRDTASSSGQSSRKHVLQPLKGMTNSAQKTLMSALAFAARIESENVKTSDNGRKEGNCSTMQNGNVIGGFKSNSTKIYEFLSSLSDKGSQDRGLS